MSIIDTSGRIAAQLATVCPKAPPGAQVHVDTVQGYVMWGVLTLFAIGAIIVIGAVICGRIFSMPHASRAGVIGGVVIFVAAIAYFVFPAIIDSMMGSGCL